MSTSDLEAFHEKDDESSTPPEHTHVYEINIVIFDGKNDPELPLSWPVRKKMIMTMLYGVTTAGSTWCVPSIFLPKPAISPPAAALTK